MAVSAVVSVIGSISGSPGGGIQIGPLTITSAAASWQVQQIALANGTNTITVPVAPATSGCVIIFPITSTAVHTLKGVAGDTGIALGKVTFQLLTWDVTAPPASFVVSNSAADTSLPTEFIFF